MTDSYIHELSAGLLIFGITAYIVQQYISAPYGKYAPKHGSKHYYGPSINATLGWTVMESPSIYITLITYYINNDHEHNTMVHHVLLSMFVFHYIVRSLVYPLLLNSNTKQMPLAVVLSAYCFCAYNGYLQGIYLAKYSTHYNDNYMHDIRFITGTTLFVAGWCINQHSDHILRNLRTNKNQSDYVIPTGGMFNYVSAANYFGEIVEWLGYAISSWSIPAAAFSLFTILQIGGRGISYHKWYQQKFREQYPKDRKAIIPFIL